MSTDTRYWTEPAECMLDHHDYGVTHADTVAFRVSDVTRRFDPTAELPDWVESNLRNDPAERPVHEANYRVAGFALEAVKHLCGGCLATLAEEAIWQAIRPRIQESTLRPGGVTSNESMTETWTCPECRAATDVWVSGLDAIYAACPDCKVCWAIGAWARNTAEWADAVSQDIASASEEWRDYYREIAPVPLS